MVQKSPFLVAVNTIAADANLICGRGEMAEMIRGWNWDKTPLGGLDAWPEELRTVVNLMLSSPIAMAIYWGPQHVMLYNDAYRPIAGKRHPRSLGRPGGEVWAEAWHIVGPQVEKAYRSGTTTSNTNGLVPIEIDGVMEDRYWTYSFSPIYCAGRITGVYNVCIGTTEAVLSNLRLRESEASLRESEERFRTLFALAPVGVSMSDPETEHTLLANEEMERITGYSLAEMTTMRTRNFTHPDDLAGTDEFYRKIHQGDGTAVIEKRYLRKDGETIWVRVWLKRLHVPGHAGVRVLAVIQDISSARRSQAALLESEKLAVVGRLAASIAHEINNPLEAITNLIYLAQSTDDQEQRREYLATAETEVARVSAIATQTLRFHRHSTKASVVAWNDLIESVLAVYHGRMVNYGLRVERRDRGRQAVMCHSGEIRQVLSNLVGNALEATPREGGRMLLRSRAATDWRTGRKGVTFTVADNGCGMAEETTRRIFEAFYTTKGNNGTGLGLWVSSEIVQRHRGSLQVRSRNRGITTGTVFCLFLPIEARALGRGTPPQV